VKNDKRLHVAIIAPILALRVGIRAWFDAQVSYRDTTVELQVIYEAASLSDLLDERPPVDLLIIVEEALSIPDLRQAAKAYSGELALLVLSDDPTTAARLAGLPFRAWGLLNLEASEAELVAAAYALEHGLLVGDPTLLRPAFSQPHANLDEDGEIGAEALSAREREVLDFLARGLANKQIALALGISEHTVKFHLSSIYTKLGVANRAEAVRAGIQRGLVSL
jgi:DNA-binding NarL/FixJ family response regulator